MFLYLIYSTKLPLINVMLRQRTKNMYGLSTTTSKSGVWSHSIPENIRNQYYYLITYTRHDIVTDKTYLNYWKLIYTTIKV